jgi:hypothetical protein
MTEEDKKEIEKMILEKPKEKGFIEETLQEVKEVKFTDKTVNIPKKLLIKGALIALGLYIF